MNRGWVLHCAGYDGWSDWYVCSAEGLLGAHQTCSPIEE